MNHKNLFMDISTFDPSNMRYAVPLGFYKETRSMGIYYKKCGKAERCKIIVKTPKMLTPFPIKEFDYDGKKSFFLSLSFNTMTSLYNEDDIKKFYSFIKTIDKTNVETVSDNIKEWKLPRKIRYKKTIKKTSESFPSYMNIKLPTDSKDNFLFDIYDDEAKRASEDILGIRSIVSVVMELTDLKFTNKQYRANWTVLQIRKFKSYSPIQEYFLSGCFIVDEDDSEDNVYSKLVPKYTPPCQITNTGPPPPPPPLVIKKEPSINRGYVPTLGDLLGAKNNLKKINQTTLDPVPTPIVIPDPIKYESKLDTLEKYLIEWSKEFDVDTINMLEFIKKSQ